MSFLNKIWKSKIKIGSFFGSSVYELEHFLCGIGESKISEKSIAIWNYPFEPSVVYPEKEIQFNEVVEIHLNTYPPTIKIGEDLIFISKESEAQLKAFAHRNNIRIVERMSNWSWITEPFLDTEFDDEQKKRTIELLEGNGVSEKEAFKWRAEIEKQMYKYNFDTMLWEWEGFGLNDVLSAVRPTLAKEAFNDFYWRAMEIEQRKK